MAILHKSVLGNFSNKVGGAVGSSWKGVPSVRSLAASVANPKSAAQISQRLRITFLTWFSKPLLNSWIRPLWNPGSKKMSGFNRFIRSNFQAFNDDGDIRFGYVNFSDGRLLRPIGFGTAAGVGRLLLILTHERNDPLASVNDQLWLIVYDRSTNRFVFSGNTGAVRGSSPTTSLDLGLNPSAQYLFKACYVSPNGRDCSPSVTGFYNTFDWNISPPSSLLMGFAGIMGIDASNIDTNLDEVAAVAVLRNAIRVKAAMKEVRISGSSVIDVSPSACPGEYVPVSNEVVVDKESDTKTLDLGDNERLNPQQKRGTSRNKS